MKGFTWLRWNPVDKFLQATEDSVVLTVLPGFVNCSSWRDYPAVGDSPKDVFCRHKSGARVTSWASPWQGFILRVVGVVVEDPEPVLALD
jgi:hypothetical protein